MKLNIEVELSRRQYDILKQCQLEIKKNKVNVCQMDLLQFYFNKLGRRYVSQVIMLLKTDVDSKKYLVKDYFKRG